MDWFQIGKGVRQGCILSPCLFNLCAEYIMQNSRLHEAEVGIKTDRRNINNLRYADDTTLWQKVKRNQVQKAIQRWENRLYKFVFSTVDLKHVLQSMWLQGSVTGSMRISTQIWHWHSNKEGMVCLGTAILICYKVYSPSIPEFWDWKHQMSLSKKILWARYTVRPQKAVNLSVLKTSIQKGNKWTLTANRCGRADGGHQAFCGAEGTCKVPFLPLTR